jgi:hypothetical protein
VCCVGYGERRGLLAWISMPMMCLGSIGQRAGGIAIVGRFGTLTGVVWGRGEK